MSVRAGYRQWFPDGVFRNAQQSSRGRIAEELATTNWDGEAVRFHEHPVALVIFHDPEAAPVHRGEEPIGLSPPR